MDFFQSLNQWWNLPFLIMLGLVAVFFVLQLVGIFDHDHDVDADHDLDHDVDADADHDHDADVADAAASWHDVLAFFGVGKVPFMVVWVTFFLFTGFTGIFFNRILSVSRPGGYIVWYFFVVFFVALFVGAIGVRLFSRLAAKLVDTGGRGSSQKHELAGRVGVVASTVLNADFGEVRVRDDHGNELLVHGRLAAGEAPLAHESKVVLVDFDADKELFWVAAIPELDKKG